MDHSTPNQQSTLAELVVLNDIQNNFTSYEAVLSIERWKFMIRIPGISQHLRQEADENILKNFLSYIGNEEVLCKEGYFEPTLNN
jgi:hypothetical protein